MLGLCTIVSAKCMYFIPFKPVKGMISQACAVSHLLLCPDATRAFCMLSVPTCTHRPFNMSLSLLVCLLCDVLCS